jgi:hypothetical protein
MHRPITRPAIAGPATGILLSLALAGPAAAQVATLSDPASDDEATPAPAAVAGEEALLEFAACMRDNGIEFDDPRFGAGGTRFGGAGTPGGGGFDLGSSEFQAAFEACGSLLAALQPDLDADEQAEQAEQQLLLAECMREQGWDFPDPITGGGFGVQLQRFEEAGVDIADPAFQEAVTDCQAASGFEPRLPGGGPG